MININYEEIFKRHYGDDEITGIVKINNHSQLKIHKIKTKNSKFFYLKTAFDEFSKTRKDKEIFVCEFLKNNLFDFPCVVPEKIYADDKINIYIENSIEGNTIGKFIENNKFVEAVYRNLAALMLSMHSIGIDENVKRIISPELNNWRSYVRTSFFDHIDVIAKNNFLAAELIDGLNDYWCRHEAALDDVKSHVLLHNDLDQNNYLVDPKLNNKCIAGIIDFERCMIGDPVKEISKLIWVFRKNPVAAKTFMSNYFRGFDDLRAIEIKIKLYFIWDILNHLRQQNYLLQFPEWGIYIDEEKKLLTDILIKKERNLW